MRTGPSAGRGGRSTVVPPEARDRFVRAREATELPDEAVLWQPLEPRGLLEGEPGLRDLVDATEGSTDATSDTDVRAERFREGGRPSPFVPREELEPASDGDLVPVADPGARSTSIGPSTDGQDFPTSSSRAFRTRPTPVAASSRAVSASFDSAKIRKTGSVPEGRRRTHPPFR